MPIWMGSYVIAGGGLVSSLFGVLVGPKDSQESLCPLRRGLLS